MKKALVPIPDVPPLPEIAISSSALIFCSENTPIPAAIPSAAWVPLPRP